MFFCILLSASRSNLKKNHNFKKRGEREREGVCVYVKGGVSAPSSSLDLFVNLRNRVEGLSMGRCHIANSRIVVHPTPTGAQRQTVQHRIDILIRGAHRMLESMHGVVQNASVHQTSEDHVTSNKRVLI